MDNASTAGATPPTAPVFPVFAAVAVGMTGRTVYQVIDAVGGIFEAAGAVFEGSPDAPGTLIALLPPSDAAALRAVELGLQAQSIEGALRLGVDAVEVHAKKEQDARWQQVIDSAVTLQKAARTGEAIAGDAIGQLTHGAAATEALRVGEDTFLLLTGMHELSAVPDPSPAAVPEPNEATATTEIAPTETSPPVEHEEEMTAAAAAHATPAPVEAAVAAPPVPIPAGETGPVAAADDLYPKAPEPDQEVTPAPVQVAASVEPVATPSMHPTARWDGPLVGRDAQLADLRARFDRVVADGSPATVLITGEPGSGRTRLVTEFAASLDAANVLHRGCAPADGGGARWPLAGLVEALAGLHPLAPAEPARARLAALFEGQPDGDDVVPHLASMIAVDGPSDPDHVRWALRRLIEVTAGGRPTIVHVDDADRAGAGFVRLLADVATATRGHAAVRRCDHHPRDRRSARDPATRPRPRDGAHLGRPTPRCFEGRRRRGARRAHVRAPACDRAVARDAHRERHPVARERAMDAARRSHPRAVAGHDDRCDQAASADAAAARTRGPRHGSRRRRARRDRSSARGRARRRAARRARLSAGSRGARVPRRRGRRDVPVPPRAPAGGHDDRGARLGPGRHARTVRTSPRGHGRPPRVALGRRDRRAPRGELPAPAGRAGRGSRRRAHVPLVGGDRGRRPGRPGRRSPTGTTRRHVDR